VLRHDERFFAANAAAGARNDRNFTLEKTCHVTPPYGLSRFVGEMSGPRVAGSENPC
jgi:hypothetical protein